MDLGNSVETVVYHLLIRGMACLGHRDGFLMVSVLVYVMHIAHDLQQIMTQVYQFL